MESGNATKSLKEVLLGIEAEFFGNPEIKIKGIEYDSRKVREGCAFVAIKGSKTDSHDLIKDIFFTKNVRAFIVEDLVKIPKYVFENSSFAKVKSTRENLGKIARNFYGQKTKVIGITGTKGKSTTVKIIAKSLSLLGRRCGILGSVWWKLTTPEASDTLKIMSESYFEIFAMEVTSISVVQKRIEGIDFEYGAFLGLGRDHLDFHKTMENYFSAKLEFLKKAKKVVIFEDEWGKKAVEILKGEGKEVFSFQKSQIDYKDGKFLLHFNGERAMFRPKILGSFNGINYMTAYIILKDLGFSKDEICNTFEEIEGPPGRMEIVSYNPLSIVDYSHTPESLSSAIDECLKLKKDQNSRLFVVFGCGGERDRGKRPEMGRASLKADIVIITSDNPRGEDPDEIIKDILSGIDEESIKSSKVFVEPDRKRAIFFAVERANENDIILVAGKGHEEYQIIGNKVIPFSDRRTILEALEKKHKNIKYKNNKFEIKTDKL